MKTVFQQILLVLVMAIAAPSMAFEPPNSMGNSGVPEGC